MYTNLFYYFIILLFPLLFPYTSLPACVYLIQNLLLENISQLEDKEEESLLPSNLPLSSDNNYLKLTAEDEADMMEEMDREMGTLDVKDSPRVRCSLCNIRS